MGRLFGGSVSSKKQKCVVILIHLPITLHVYVRFPMDDTSAQLKFVSSIDLIAQLMYDN